MIPLYSRSSDIRNLALGAGCQASSALSWLYQDELPDTVWFQLGTAAHAAIEDSILENLNKADTIGAGLTYLTMEKAAATNGTIESASKRAKRSIATQKDDLINIVGQWWDDVHPDSEHRKPIFDLYQWPPKVEHEIQLHETDQLSLYTTVDAIFKAKPGEAPFGEEVAIVDWKTGSKAHSNETQLQVYAYGGRKEGWFPDDATSVGFFWHAASSKAQRVYGYVGDQIVEKWIKDTHRAKQAMLEDKAPRFVQDWWCGTCQARDMCPVQNPKGGKTLEEIGISITEATLLTEPDNEREG